MPKSHHSRRSHGKRHMTLGKRHRDLEARQAPVVISRQEATCSSEGAIALSTCPMSFLGVIDLEKGRKYRTPDGILISWYDDTIIVYEPKGTSLLPGHSDNFWQVTDTPPLIIDGLGQRIPFPTASAIFALGDGSRLLVGAKGPGPIAQARYFYAGIPLTVENLKGYSAHGITVFSSTGLSKLPETER